MSKTDSPLKVLVQDFAIDFAAWLLNVPVDEVRYVRIANVELQPEPVQPAWSDTVFQVVLADAREVLLHIEFQGLSTHRPMPWRMLDYMSRLAEREQMDLCSVVFYVGDGAGRDDNGQHQVMGPDGALSLLWRYRVIRLWEMPAEDLLNLERPALLPLIGQTQLVHPEGIVPEVVQTIGRIESSETQARLFTALVNLMRDEEVIQMTEKLVQRMDRGLLMDTPYLRRVRQEAREEVLAEVSEELSAKQHELQTVSQKAQDLMRESVLDVLVEQFNPSVIDYRRVAAQLQKVTALEDLRACLQAALHAADFVAFEQTLQEQLESPTSD
jgi:predicted transposase YdaD